LKLFAGESREQTGPQERPIREHLGFPQRAMKKLNLAAIVCYFIGIALSHADYSTNTITTPGGVYAFSVNGSDPVNPTVQLVAGVTNVLIIDTDPIHPVVITSTPNIFDWYAGADAQVVNEGLINVTTPDAGFPSALYYMCYNHGFYGEIDISPPLSPTPLPTPSCKFKWETTS
jgi:hypothetical protein